MLPLKEQINYSALDCCRSVIKRLLIKNNLSAAELARRINLPQPTVHRLLVGKTEDPKLSTLNLIADYFAISLDQLLSNIPLDDNDKTNIVALSIPILSWTQVLEGLDSRKKLTSNNWNDWCVLDIQASKNSFALRSKPSMEPTFPTDSIIVIDPDVTPQDGNYVVAHYQNTTEATLREIALDGPRRELCTLAENSQKDQIEEGIKLLGVVIQTRFSFK